MNVSMYIPVCLLDPVYDLNLLADQSVANATAIRPNNPTATMNLVTASMTHAARGKECGTMTGEGPI